MSNSYKNVHAKIEDVAVRLRLLGIALNRGFKICEDDGTRAYARNPEGYPFVIYQDTEDNEEGFGFVNEDNINSSDRIKPSRFIEMMETYSPPREVELNNELTAVIRKDGSVTVGCQELPKKVIKKFVEAWMETIGTWK